MGIINIKTVEVRRLKSVRMLKVWLISLMVASITLAAFSLGVIGDQQRIITALRTDEVRTRTERNELASVLEGYRLGLFDDAETARRLEPWIRSIPTPVTILIELDIAVDDKVWIICRPDVGCSTSIP